MTEFVQVFGSDDPLASGSCLLWSDSSRVCFNCPEGMQRFTSEVRARLTRVGQFYFTRVVPGSCMGLPGVMFTVNDAGVKKLTIGGCGPALAQLWGTVKSHFYHHRVMDTTIVDSAKAPKDVHGPITVLALPCGTLSAPGTAGVAADVGAVFSYLCFVDPLPVFLPARAKALGVAPGRKYALLKRGIAVESDADPSVTVQPAEVVAAPSGPAGAVLIADCATPADFPDLAALEVAHSVVVHTVIHAGPAALTATPAYAAAVAAAVARASAAAAGGVRARLAAGTANRSNLDYAARSAGTKSSGAGPQGPGSSGGPVSAGEAPRHVMAAADYRQRLSSLPTALAHRHHLALVAPDNVHVPGRPLVAGGAGGRGADWPHHYRYSVRDGAAVMDDPVTFPTAAVAGAMLSSEFFAEHIPGHSPCPALMSEQTQVEHAAGVLGAASDQAAEPQAVQQQQPTLRAGHLPPTDRHGVGAAFFGTGSAVPSKYRNVSSMAITMAHGAQRPDAAPPFRPSSAAATTVLCDCGEGTTGQWWNALIGSRGDGSATLGGRVAAGGDQAERCRLHEYVLGIDAVLVSHMHADHHLGVFGILALRKAALGTLPEAERAAVPPLLVAGPESFVAFAGALLQEDGGPFAGSCGAPGAGLYCLESFTADAPPSTDTAGALTSTMMPGCDQQLRRFCSARGWAAAVFHVDHPAAAHGLVLREVTPAGCLTRGFLYSGDTQPCPSVAAFGRGVSLLIHEATFADDMTAEARSRRHSTVAEAVEAARAARADVLALFHFSQRYPKFPTIADSRPDGNPSAATEEEFPRNMVVSFDLMSLPTVSGAATLGARTPAFQALLAEYDAWGDGTTKRLRDARDS